MKLHLSDCNNNVQVIDLLPRKKIRQFQYTSQIELDVIYKINNTQGHNLTPLKQFNWMRRISKRIILLEYQDARLESFYLAG